MSVQYGFYINQSRCSGCHACQTSCNDKNDLEPGRLFRRIKETDGGEFTPLNQGYAHNAYAFFTSISCNHCDHPKCTEACPSGAMHKDPETGIVSVNPNRCIGCRYCTWACPYGAPQYNKEAGQMSKCDFCADLLSQGETPVCVAACPYEALDYGPIEELRAKYGTLADSPDLPSSNETHPNIVIKPHKR
ncbi:MAG TPA: dimethylsulfoxide reductase subunit B [Desulfitobacterium dehalogenans]|uniref:Dimethylsulfoxide reductase subunit B n=1 Tax=Desulfitobacterium dehalogenans TaxID=36854 RepID=A0A7C6Z2I5_9FIRM|nr:dimethylsulfoxide reductase subunit B [Desulfitobacterium dehalogenans]